MTLWRKYLIDNTKILHRTVQVMLVLFTFLTVISDFYILEKSPVEIEITESDDSNPEDTEIKLKDADLWFEYWQNLLSESFAWAGFRNNLHKLPTHLAANISTPPPERI